MTDHKPDPGLGSDNDHTTQPITGPYGGGRPPFPPMPPHTPAVQPNSRNRVWLKYGAVALVSLLVGAGMGASGDTGSEAEAAADTKAGPRPTVTVTETAPAAEAEPAPTVTETVTETVTAKPKKTKEPGPATTFSGDGEYLVGEDIKAGTYKTAGPEDEWGCYWERAKDASGEFGSIIANNNLEGTGRVTLNKGEYFKTNRCQEWKRVG
ncbi:hypothetical protein RVN83_31220 [Streptomyces sp. PU10]|uniref:hypothetical protein n=1 Tax=Streptomyces sp. PU10 TaxID=3062780 RepID=UPI0028FC6ECA|nr:hypothetical protein [Streptomyces sp. PU10]MDU0257455.1 hypothetical protein [Streptomyces sp. PU10]